MRKQILVLFIVILLALTASASAVDDGFSYWDGTQLLTGMEARQAAERDAAKAALDAALYESASEPEPEPDPDPDPDLEPVQEADPEPEPVPEPVSAVVPEEADPDPDEYPLGSYIDPEGRVWSSEGELLSEAVPEPYAAGEVVTVTAVEILEAIEGVKAVVGEIQTIMDDLDTDIIDGLEHPLLTTPFEQYSVTEGLLLLLLLHFFVTGCISILKEGFAWLR